MRYRNSRVGGHRHGRRDARHNFEREPRGGNRLRLLASPSEDERVAPLQPDHHFSLPGLLDDQPIHLILILVPSTASAADIDAFGVRWDMVQQDRIRQVVIEHHIGLLKTLLPAKGEELLVARAGPYEIDFSKRSHDNTQALP